MFIDLLFQRFSPAIFVVLFVGIPLGFFVVMVFALCLCFVSFDFVSVLHW